MSAKTNTAPSLSFGASVLRVGLGVVAGCAREYLGEGYLQKGDLTKAKDQLAEIAARCTGSCEECKLEQAIVSSVTEGGSTDW